MEPETAAQADETLPEILRREVDAEMIRGLYRRVRPLVVANFGALILLTGVLWSSVDSGPLLVWAVALGLWTTLRFGLARLYMRRPRRLEETGRWTLAFAAGAGVAGCLWGSSVLLVDFLGGENAHLVTAFIMAALSAAAIAGYTNSLLAFAAFVAPALLPYSWRLIHLDGSFDPVIALFVAFWGLLLWVMARHLNEGFRESLALGLRNGHLAERLGRERDRAEAASLAKSRFLGNVSHELRTPLNAILGYSEMMRQEILGPIGNKKYAEYIGDIHDSGAHLLGLVDQILDITKIEAGQIDLEEEWLSIEDLLDQARRTVEPQADRDGLDLTTEIERGLPQLWGDPTKLRQALLNLLANAVKFTPEGGRVEIAVRPLEQGGVEIAVADSGIGIAPEHLELVQVPFAQLEGRDYLLRQELLKDSGSHTSSGLGLPLAKLLIEAHGGRFLLESAPGEGTAARMRLPAARCRTAPAAAA